MRILAATSLTIALAACSTSGSDPQIITGRVDRASFPAPVDQVIAVANGKTVATAALGDQGDFTLALPANASYRIELTSASQRTGLVAPRATGAIDTTFTVTGSAAPFDLGTVRWIGAATSVTYHYESGDGDGECEDGMDTQTGQPCVDDNSMSCGDDDGESSDDGEAEDGDGDGETNDDGPTDSAIADHNLPSSIGCEGEDGGDDGDGESGDD